MVEPIKAGDMAEVVGGYTGARSPNLGKLVTVKMLIGETHDLGKIWRCEGPGLVAGRYAGNCPEGQADFARAWLRKIEPPKMVKAHYKEEETA